MAYQTGVATDHEDLWDKLIAFLTTDAELVALNQNWIVAWDNEDSNSDPISDGPKVVLQGPGLSQQDEIFVSMYREDNVDQDVSTIFLRGCTGVVQTADDYDEHINVQPFPVRTFMRTQAMNYWFAANGRRFIAIIQVGSLYECMYAGFFLPYGDPTVYGYPMFVGGSDGFGLPGNSDDWRDTGNSHSAFPYARYNSNASNGYNPSAWMLSPAGDWLRCSIDSTASGAYLGPNFFGEGGGIGDDINKSAGSTGYGYESILRRMGRMYGDSFALTPITLTQASPGDQTFGVLDGVYHVPGRGQSVENKIGANNLVHFVSQDIFRTAENSYFAVALYPEDSNSGLDESSNS